MGGLTHGRQLDTFLSTRAYLAFVSKFTQQVSSKTCECVRAHMRARASLSLCMDIVSIRKAQED